MKPRTMYMHTLDKRPARVIRFTHDRTIMVPVTRHVRLKPLSSLAEIRAEWNEVADDEFARSMRESPAESYHVHNEAALALLKRLGYVLVEVPGE